MLFSVTQQRLVFLTGILERQVKFGIFSEVFGFENFGFGSLATQAFLSGTGPLVYGRA